MDNKVVVPGSSNEPNANSGVDKVVTIASSDMIVDSLHITGDFGYSEGWEVSDGYVDMHDSDIAYDASVEDNPNEDDPSEATQIASAREVVLISSSDDSSDYTFSSTGDDDSSERSEISNSSMEIQSSDVTCEPGVEDESSEITQISDLSGDEIMGDTVSCGVAPNTEILNSSRRNLACLNENRPGLGCTQKFLPIKREDRIVLVENSSGDFEENKVALSDEMVMIVESSTEETKDQGVGTTVDKGVESKEPIEGFGDNTWLFAD